MHFVNCRPVSNTLNKRSFLLELKIPIKWKQLGPMWGTTLSCSNMNTWKVKIPDRFNIELIVHIYLKLLVYEIVHHWPFITNLPNEVDSVHWKPTGAATFEIWRLLTGKVAAPLCKCKYGTTSSWSQILQNLFSPT